MEWFVWSGVAIAGAYLLGAIPTGYWAGRLLKGIDLREHGSKSTGATNVLRTLGKVPAVVVLLIDVLKGSGAIALTRWLYTLPASAIAIPASFTLEQWVPWMVVAAGLAAIIGHSKSLWIGFKGGKSVATGLGVMLAMTWQVGLGALGVFGLTLATSRIVSLGSILAAIATPLLMLLFRQPLPYVLMTTAAAAYIWGTHRANIQRLLAGTEPQIGQNHRTGQG